MSCNLVVDIKYKIKKNCLRNEVIAVKAFFSISFMPETVPGPYATLYYNTAIAVIQINVPTKRMWFYPHMRWISGHAVVMESNGSRKCSGSLLHNAGLRWDGTRITQFIYMCIWMQQYFSIIMQYLTWPTGTRQFSNLNVAFFFPQPLGDIWIFTQTNTTSQWSQND